MGYSFGPESRREIATLHPDLALLCNTVIQVYDFSVLEGHRSNERQAELLRQGKSKLGPGESKHNSNPSRAVDCAPYPIDWDNHARFYLLAGMFFQAANEFGIYIRWGGDWDRDWVHSDQSFFDLPHFELV